MTFKLASDTYGSVTADVPASPIGTTKTSVPGVTLNLYSVQRAQPGAVLAVFGVDSTGDLGVVDETDVDEALSESSATSYEAVSGVAVLDATSLKEYKTFIADPTDDGTCLCSMLPDLDSPGEHYEAALLAAPPASTTTVSFVTGLGSIANVHLS